MTDGTTAERERGDESRTERPPTVVEEPEPGESETEPVESDPESTDQEPERDVGLADDLESLVAGPSEEDAVGDDATADASEDVPTQRTTGSMGWTPLEATIDSESVETTTDRTGVERDGRWRVGLLFALAAGGAGVAVGSTAVFLSALVGLVYSGYTLLSAPPAPSLVVERALDEPSPAPGDLVTVTVTVKNAGSSVLPDVRVADRPPEGLTVVAGETRHAATVEPGAVIAYEYVVRARRGKHRFDDVVTLTRAASGAAARREVHDTARSVVCYAPFEALELADQAGPGTGRVETDTGGEGVEFYATRRYDPSDPVGRIDWNRYAATGELSTVVYRETRAATVVFVVDGRHDLRRQSDEPSAVALCAYATVRVADALLDESNDVGMAVIDDSGLESSATGRYIEPASGRVQSVRVRRLLEQSLGVSVDDLTADSGGDATDAGSRSAGSLAGSLDRFRERFPSDAQVVYVSPLLDGHATLQVERLAARDHATTVLSPNVTDTATAGGTVECIERAERVRSLRTAADIRVVDWSLDESLQAAVTRDSAGWDR